MIVKLNKIEVEIDTSGFATAGDLLESLKSNHLNPADFITSISLNGETVPEEKQEKLITKQLSEVELFEVDTDNPRDLSVRTLAKMDELVDSLTVMLEESADKFRVEDEKIANQYFINCVEALHTFADVIVKVKVLNSIDYTDIIYNSEPVSIKEEALQKVFSSLHEAQKSKDWISLADLVEYELLPVILEWKEIFPIISDTVKSRNN